MSKSERVRIAEWLRTEVEMIEKYGESGMPAGSQLGWLLGGLDALVANLEAGADLPAHTPPMRSSSRAS